MKTILSILVLLIAVCHINAQTPKIRKTSDVTNSGTRTIGWEIFNSENQDIISSGSEAHIESMMGNEQVRAMLQNILINYLDANNISDPEGGAPTKLVKWTTGNILTAADVNPVSLTNLSFSYQPNTSYLIKIRGRIQPAAATSGIGLQFDLSSAVTQVNVDFSHQLANTGTRSGGHSIADDASVAVSSGFPGTSTYPVVGEAWIRTGANAGTAQLRLRSETTGVVTAMSGFVMIVERL